MPRPAIVAFVVGVLLVIAVGLSQGGAPAAAAAKNSPHAADLLIYQLQFGPELDPQRDQPLYSDLLEESLQAAGLRVIGRRDLATMIDVNAAVSRAQECDTGECLLDLGRLVDVTYYLSGRFARVDGALTVSIKIVDRRTQIVVVRLTRRLGRRLPEIRAWLAALASEAVAGLADADAGPGFWSRFDTAGKAGVVTASAGVATVLVGIGFALIAADDAGRVQPVTGGLFTDQRAALGARSNGHIADGLWAVGGALAIGGVILSLLGYDGGDEGTPATPGAPGSTVPTALRF